MLRLSKIITSSIPKAIYCTAKMIVWLPSKTLNSALAISSLYGLQKTINEGFERENCFFSKKEGRDYSHSGPVIPNNDERAITLTLKPSFYKRTGMWDLEKNSLTLNDEDEENYFCGRKLSVNWIHKYKIYNKFVNISDVSLTHTSRGSLTSSSGSEEGSEFKSFSKIVDPQDVQIRSASSNEFEKSSSVKTSSHPWVPNIKSRLKIVFT